jgi:F-type H+-transporting ATPase subunit b
MTEAVTNPGVLAALGINGKLFLAQLINFGILLFVVVKWVYRPLLKTVDERSKKIADGLTHADEAKKQLAKAEEHASLLVQKAEGDARTILDDARKGAETERQSAVAQTKQDLERQLADARERLKSEKEAALHAVKNEVAALVMAATEKVLQKSMDEKTQKQLVESAIKEVDQP